MANTTTQKNTNSINDMQQHNFTLQLLFTKPPKQPTAGMILHTFKAKFGDISIISRSEGDIRFTVNNYLSYLQDNAGSSTTQPVELHMGAAADFDDKTAVSEAARNQPWYTEDIANLLSQCKYALTISDVNAQGQIPKERAQILMQYLDSCLKLFPDCAAVWLPASEKLQSVQKLKQLKQDDITRFVLGLLNVRFFNLPPSSEFIIDSLGLCSIGLSDIQFHFAGSGLKPSKVANLTYRLAWYILNTSADEFPIRDGDTIDGLDDNGEMNPLIQWTCRYEDSLIAPLRPVLDVAPGKYAVGERK